MLLVVDIGNTNITCGIYNETELVKTFRLVTDKNVSVLTYEELFKEKLNNWNFDGCIIASVVDEITTTIKQACDNVLKLNSMLLDLNLDLGVVLGVAKPSEVGADRIANASAVNSSYDTPAIVIDSGTATTFDVISKDGKFLGGIIFPGIDLQLKSLHINTSRLPEIKAQEVKTAIGYDTESAILSGVIRGSACTIEGLIKQCEAELGEKATIVGTGGHINLLAKYMSIKLDDINQQLTLDGLKNIYELNKK